MKTKQDITFSKERKSKQGYTVCDLILNTNHAKQIAKDHAGFGPEKTEIFAKDKATFLAWAISHHLSINSKDSIIIQDK